MLDLLPASVWNDQKTFFEPACGNGNFLVAILRRKLAKIPQPSARHPQQDVEFEILRSLSSIYGTDICPQNVEETRQRLRGVITDHTSETKYWDTHHTSTAFLPLVEDILTLNIQQANALEPGKTLICEWQVPGTKKFRKVFHYLKEIHAPVYEDKEIHAPVYEDKEIIDYGRLTFKT